MSRSETRQGSYFGLGIGSLMGSIFSPDQVTAGSPSRQPSQTPSRLSSRAESPTPPRSALHSEQGSEPRSATTADSESDEGDNHDARSTTGVDSDDEHHEFSMDSPVARPSRRVSLRVSLPRQETWSNLLLPASQARARGALAEAVKAARGRLKPCKYVGPDLGKNARWGNGCRGPSGVIFFAPRSASHILRVDTTRGVIEEWGSSLSFKWDAKKDNKFSDAVMGKDGCLYLIPAMARYVMSVDAATGVATSLGDDLGARDWKFGRAVECGGKIFAAPHQSSKIMMIDPMLGTTSFIGEDIGSDACKYFGAVKIPNPAAKPGDDAGALILFIPLNARRLLVLNPKTLETCYVGGDLGGLSMKFFSGALAYGSVYCAPANAPHVLRIDFPTMSSPSVHGSTGYLKDKRSLQAQGSVDENVDINVAWPPECKVVHLGPARNAKFKFVDSVLSSDGKTVIGVPMSEQYFIGICTDSGQKINKLGTRLDSLRLRLGGAVLGEDGFVYCAPFRSRQLLRLDTFSIAEQGDHHERAWSTIIETARRGRGFRRLI